MFFESIEILFLKERPMNWIPACEGMLFVSQRHSFLGGIPEKCIPESAFLKIRQDLSGNRQDLSGNRQDLSGIQEGELNAGIQARTLEIGEQLLIN
jgi:hypothetical protein